jgi:hypothetical protein
VGPGSDHPRMPQPLVETLALQDCQIAPHSQRFRTRHVLGLDPRMDAGSREENA